jgi:hypothetical protein
VNEARNATPDHMFSDNMNKTEREESIKQVVAIFNEVTANFESQVCLSFSEEKMREWEFNCYYVIADKITSTFGYGEYLVVVGEGAYMKTQSWVNHVPSYQFHLGPMFISVTNREA